uniref:C2H2-type domain-containing protein n=2 Tax=Parascaris univalens TaxID=6257 RepID=A0A915BZU6_PARUN
MDVLRKQSEQQLLEIGLRGGFARLQSVRVPKHTSPSRLQNKVVLTTATESIIDDVTTGSTSNESALEIEEVFLPPKKPEVTDNSRQKYQRFREKKFTCEHCGHTFTLKHNMYTHIANYHTGEGKTLRPRGKRYRCLKCGWMCRTTNEVKSHQRRAHDTPKEKCHTCIMCNKNFRSQGLMREHYSTVHLNERPYECTICMTSFGRRGGLRRHNIMKHSDFVYACPYEECTHPGFKCSKALTAHICSVHTHIRPYKCGQCERSFVRRNDLRTHEALHSATLEHICDICGQKFKRASYLKRHSKTRHEHPNAAEDQNGAQIESFYSGRSSDTEFGKTTSHLSCSQLKSPSFDNATAVIRSDELSSRHRFSLSQYK